MLPRFRKTGRKSVFLQLLYLLCACINDFIAFSQRLGPKFVQNCVPAKMMARHGKWLKSKNPPQQFRFVSKAKKIWPGQMGDVGMLWLKRANELPGLDLWYLDCVSMLTLFGAPLFETWAYTKQGLRCWIRISTAFSYMNLVDIS